MKKLCLNLGAGENPRVSNEKEEWVNIDNFKTKHTDKVHDLNNGIPYEDSSIDYIYMDNVLEHLKGTKFQVEEIYRVLKKGGKANIIVPHYSYPV